MTMVTVEHLDAMTARLRAANPNAAQPDPHAPLNMIIFRGWMARPNYISSGGNSSAELAFTAHCNGNFEIRNAVAYGAIADQINEYVSAKQDDFIFVEFRGELFTRHESHRGGAKLSQAVRVLHVTFLDN